LLDFITFYIVDPLADEDDEDEDDEEEEEDEEEEADEMDDESECICGKCPWAENDKNVR